VDTSTAPCWDILCWIWRMCVGVCVCGRLVRLRGERGERQVVETIRVVPLGCGQGGIFFW
jgi:hypothetical protein